MWFLNIIMVLRCPNLARSHNNYMYLLYAFCKKMDWCDNSLRCWVWSWNNCVGLQAKITKCSLESVHVVACLLMKQYLNLKFGYGGHLFPWHCRHDYERCLRHDPGYLPARVNLAYNLQVSGHYQQAWHQFTAAIALQNGETSYHTCQLYNCLCSSSHGHTWDHENSHIGPWEQMVLKHMCK